MNRVRGSCTDYSGIRTAEGFVGYAQEVCKWNELIKQAWKYKDISI